MGILDAFKRRNYAVQTVYITGSVKGMSPAKLYETQPALRAVVSFLADNVASLPLKCYVRNADGGRTRDRTSALALLIDHPNEWTTTHELIRNTVSEYLLYDDTVWLTLPADSPSGWQVVPIPNAWIKAKTRDGLTVEYIDVQSKYGAIEKIKPDDFIRFCGWSPDGSAYASCRIDALKEILAEQISAWAFRNGIWKNQGRVQQWISRPADTPWGDGARDRFAESWKNKFSGNDGTDTGGTPLLEDGMRLETATFNAKEAQWVEATKLSREDVAAVFHVNPGMIWSGEGQSYASVKENARALYADTLAPLLDMIAERINAFLVPRLGLDSTHYCEFDLDAKLQGSFEERASVMQSSVGAPWLTRNEARAMLNLPAIDGGDELVTPLNVLIGGQAAPNDVDGVESGYYSAEPQVKSAPATPAGVHVKSTATNEDTDEISATLKKFFKRQARSLVPKLDKSRGFKSDDFPKWWNAERWERELAEDLQPIFQRQAVARAKQAAILADLDPDEISADRMENYIAAMAMGKSKAINNVTYRQLQAALDLDDDEIDPEIMGDTVHGVFEKAETTRADVAGASFATAVAGFAILELCNQLVSDSRGVMKTWVVTSSNPRAEHAALDGETVPYEELFSNGARFPGDQNLTAEESCNCRCEVDIYIP